VSRKSVKKCDVIFERTFIENQDGTLCSLNDAKLHAVIQLRNYQRILFQIFFEPNLEVKKLNPFLSEKEMSKCNYLLFHLIKARINVDSITLPFWDHKYFLFKKEKNNKLAIFIQFCLFTDSKMAKIRKYLCKREIYFFLS